MRANQRAYGRRCRFESLENRQMMAGDVTAQIVNGNLKIKGDVSNNNIAVAVADGTVTLTSADTTVNGAIATAGVALTGTLTGKVKVNLKGGTDGLTLAGPLTVPGKLEIDNTETVMNTGTLTVNGKMDFDDVSNLTLVSTTVNGNMDIEGTKGVDTFSLTGTKVTGKAEIETGKGNDTVTVTAAAAAGATFGSLEVELGKGNDTLKMSNTTGTGKTKVDGGKGSDTFDQTGDNNVFTGGLKTKHFETMIP